MDWTTSEKELALKIIAKADDLTTELQRHAGMYEDPSAGRAHSVLELKLAVFNTYDELCKLLCDWEEGVEGE